MSTMNAADLKSPAAQSDPLNSITLGNGSPTIVMLHGWGKSLEVLRPMADALASRCTVVAVDLPGFGLSPLPQSASNEGGGWSTAQYAARVKEFLDQSGISRCVLFGHSFGGRVAVHLAAEHPTLISGLILCGTPGVPRVRTPLEKLRLSSIRTLGKLAKRCDGLLGTRAFEHYFAPRFGSIDYKNAGPLRKTLVKTVNEDLSALARKIACPTMLIWGANDRESTVDQAHTYRSLISDSELHLFPNKGHEPYADVGSHLVVFYIESFLTKRGILS